MGYVNVAVRLIKKSIIVAIIPLLMVVTLVSCNFKKQPMFTTSSRDADKMGYNSEIITIDLGTHDSYSVMSPFIHEDRYYVDIVTNLYDEQTGDYHQESVVYGIDLSGGAKTETHIADGSGIDCCCTGMFLSVNDNNLCKYSTDTGELIDTIDYSYLPPIYRVIETDNGYLLFGEGFIDIRDDLDRSQGVLDNTKISYEGDLFFSEGKIYYTKPQGDVIEYYIVNLEDMELEYIADTDDIDIDGVFSIRDYTYDGYTICKVDLNDNDIKTIAEMDLIDIRPPSGRMVQPTSIDIIDEDHFAVINQYASNEVEIQLLSYDPNINTEYDSVLEVGGYGLRDDTALLWAVYLFNTDHADTRIVMTDYANEGYGYDTGEQAAAAKADLIKMFNEGNAPDIFYGDAFDYDYFGRNGIVLDLYPLMSEEISSLTPVAQRLMVGNGGKCYKVFASYMLDGFFADKNTIDTDHLSFISIEGSAPMDEIPLMRGLTYAQILDTIIRYEIPNRLDRSGDYFSIDELISSIEYSVRYGYADYATAGAMSNYSVDPVLGLAMIGDYQAYSYYYTGKFFVGYPSFDHSNMVAKPFGLMALSAGCRDVQTACELISLLFSDEVQKSCILSWSFPVTEKAVDEYRMIIENCDYSADDQLFDYLDNGITDPDLAEDYFSAMSCVSVLQTNDWGIFNIITDEMASYSQGKSIEEIAESLQSRLNLYIDENYS